jgi:DNA-repair protein XRCC4
MQGAVEEEEEGGRPALARFVLGGKSFYFYSTWREREFGIKLTDGRQVWQGIAKEEYIEKELKPEGMGMDEYMKLAERALTSQDLTKKHSYRLSQTQTQQLLLTWRIKLGTEDVGLSVKGTLGLELVRDGRAFIQRCFDWLLQKQAVLQEVNEGLVRENEGLKQMRTEAVQKLHTLIHEKKELETDLYQKFVIILNEKKKKIRDLQKQVEEAKKSGGEMANRITRHPRREADGDDGEEGNSDEDDAQGQTMRRSNKNSTSIRPQKGTFSMSGPTPSLTLLEDENNYNIKTTVRKRHRPQATNEDHNSTNGGTTTMRPPLPKKVRVVPSSSGTSAASSTSAAGSASTPSRHGQGRFDGTASHSTTTTSTRGTHRDQAKEKDRRRSVSAEDLLEMCQ